MNNWICPKCNAANTDRFCLNCGADSQSAPDLPPTVFGVPPIVPNQQNFAPNQPQFAPNQSPPQFQPQPHQQYQQEQFPLTASQPQVLPPRKSNAKKFVIIGGIIGLLVLAGGGFALWRNVIEPRLLEQRRLEIEKNNQIRANSTMAISLLPEEFTNSVQMTFRKSKTLDKMQLLQTSQNLPPELKSELNSINDAAAAEYVNTTDSNRKVVLQIFKYNSPEQAVAVCDKIGQVLKKGEASLQEVVYNPATLYRETNCHTSGAKKDGDYMGVSTLYGFMIIAVGQKDSKPGAGTSKVFDVLVR